MHIPKHEKSNNQNTRILKMKSYFRILLIVLYLVGFTLLLPFFFGIVDKLPDSYALGVIVVLLIVFLYCFVPYKIWKLKK